MNPTDFRNFLTAGRAVFTVTRKADGARYTYRVVETADSKSRTIGSRLFYVLVLTGSDNDRDYTYAGVMEVHPAGGILLRQTRKSRVSATAPSWLGLVWLVSRIDRPDVLDRFIEIDHEGKCGRCGRTLTVPESIRTGLGPTCAAKS